jgi:hypothetical protein
MAQPTTLIDKLYKQYKQLSVDDKDTFINMLCKYHEVKNPVHLREVAKAINHHIKEQFLAEVKKLFMSNH